MPLVFLQASSNPVILDFAFMAGTWHADVWGGQYEESWLQPSATTMPGVAKHRVGNETKFIEFRAIEPRENSYVLWKETGSPSKGERKIIQYKLVSVDIKDLKAVFENAHNVYPNKITYQREGDDTLKVKLEGLKDGKAASEELVLKR